MENYKKIERSIFIIILGMILSYFILLVLEFYSKKVITIDFIVLNALIMVIIGISFTAELAVSLPITGILVIFYTGYYIVEILQFENIMDNSLNVLWGILVLPFFSYFGSILKKNFSNLIDAIEKLEKYQITYEAQKKFPTLYNKNEFFKTLEEQLSLYKNKNPKIFFSVIFFKINNFDILESVFNEQEMTVFYQQIEKIINMNIKTEDLGFYLSNGEFAILTKLENSASIKVKTENLKKILLNEKFIFSNKKRPRIRFKCSNFTTDDTEINSIEVYRILKKRIEYDF